jgi:multifunctional beta-oxidation protein
MTFTDKDSILYNLSLGAKASELALVYEGDQHFQLLPSFGVIPGTTAQRPFKLEELVPNYSPKMVLHGEHYLEVRKYPISTSGTLESFCKLVDVFDKGKASVAVIGTLTKDAATGDEVFYNECSLFIRGSGGFGGRKTDASPVHLNPGRVVDRTVEEKTSADQAALYRLNGDRNPLHIDPVVSQAGGFEVPILHGLCSFGISTKHIVGQYGPIKNIKTRFTGTVTPGQSLVTEMWKDGNVVSFQARVKETGRLCISGGLATLLDGPSARL